MLNNALLDSEAFKLSISQIKDVLRGQEAAEESDGDSEFDEPAQKRRKLDIEEGDDDEILHSAKPEFPRITARPSLVPTKANIASPKIKLFDFYDSSNFVEPEKENDATPAKSPESPKAKPASSENAEPNQDAKLTSDSGADIGQMGATQQLSDTQSELSQEANPNQTRQEASLKTPSSEEPRMQTGRWDRDEHLRYLEALKLFGKNWERIYEHVESRSMESIRAHSQKFFQRLERSLNSGRSIPGLTEDDIKFYFQTLGKRVKGYSKWKIKTNDELAEQPPVLKLAKGDSVISFGKKPELKQPSSAPAVQVASAAAPSPSIPMPQTRLASQVHEIFLNFVDIDEGDEEPMVVLHFLDIGLKFNILKNPWHNPFMGVFFRFFHASTQKRFPNLAKYLMRAREQPRTTDNQGMSSLLAYDMSRFQQYVCRRENFQYSSLSLTYYSRKREVAETTYSGKPLFVPMPKWACDRYELVKSNSRETASAADSAQSPPSKGAPATPGAGAAFERAGQRPEIKDIKEGF